MTTRGAWSCCPFPIPGREITAVGNLSGVQVGETLRLTGTWTTHSRFGEQFQVSSFTAVTPATVAGIERYLGSGLVPGVGREIASRLVRKFGAETLQVIDAQPTRLREVEGIGPVRAQQIQGAWKKQRELREVMIFLQSCGISTILAARISTGCMARAAAASIRANPWGLAADIPGIRLSDCRRGGEKPRRSPRFTAPHRGGAPLRPGAGRAGRQHLGAARAARRFRRAAPRTRAFRLRFRRRLPCTPPGGRRCPGPGNRRARRPQQPRREGGGCRAPTRPSRRRPRSRLRRGRAGHLLRTRCSPRRNRAPRSPSCRRRRSGKPCAARSW